jgi:rhodanese-related sulfurtransferase
MLKKLKLLAIALAAALAAGCAQQPAQKPAQGLVRYTHIVDYAYVKQHAALPRNAKSALLVDSRPAARRYDVGHIPGAINIPDSQFDKHAGKLPADKNALVIFYCQGKSCDLSSKSAFKAEKLGYGNIKVYEAGIPDWEKHGEVTSVSTAFMQKALKEKADIVIIDSRPERPFSKGAIPGAINLSDSKFDKMIDRLPQDKAKSIIFYCGGLVCDLSEKSARKAKALGYKNVRTYAEGYPGWKKAAK